MLLLNGVCRAFKSCLKWTFFYTVFLIGSSLVNAQPINKLNVNNSTVIDMANYSAILLTISCPIHYENIGWYHDGKHYETRAEDGRSLLYLVKSFEDGGVFKCGKANDPVQNWTVVNITLGRKPSAPQSIVCTGHLYASAHCTWQPGSRKTNLPRSFKAQKKIVNKWESCNDVNETVCNLSRNDGLRLFIRVWEVNELGRSNYKEAYFNIQEDVRPLPPTGLTLTHSVQNKILAEWEVSPGWEDYYFYLIYQLRCRNNLQDWQVIKEVDEGGLRETTIEGWNVYTIYEVQVRAKYHSADDFGVWSKSVNITTKEAYPIGQLILLHKETESDDPDKNTYRNILLTWEVPETMKARGKILGFEVQLFESGMHKLTKNLTDGSLRNYTLKDLLRDTNYTIYMSAYNSVSSSAPAIINIAPSSPNLLTSVVVIAVAVFVAIVVILLLLGILWNRIKKSTFCLPLPEPKFTNLKWQNIPNPRTYIEDEVFDEVKSRRALPTRDELNKLIKKLADPTLKDIMFDLIISQCSIDHDWQKIEKRRMSRLLSTNTEVSFLSAEDEDENLMNNLMLSFEESSDGFSRCHSMPMLEEKRFTSEELYTSDSDDTSGIGSESSDQDLESEFQMSTCHSVPDVHISPSMPFIPIDKPSIKCSLKKTSSMSQKCQKSSKDVAKVNQLPTLQTRQNSVTSNRQNYLPPNSQVTRQQSIPPTCQGKPSDYLDAAQMRSMQNHPKTREKRQFIRKRPKAPGNGYLDIKDMPKFTGHHSKIPAQNIPKPSVYVQHGDLPHLLVSKNTHSLKKSDPNTVNRETDDVDMLPKVTEAECHNVSDKNELKRLNVSCYVKGASKSNESALRKDSKFKTIASTAPISTHSNSSSISNKPPQNSTEQSRLLTDVDTHYVTLDEINSPSKKDSSQRKIPTTAIMNHRTLSNLPNKGELPTQCISCTIPPKNSALLVPTPSKPAASNIRISKPVSNQIPSTTNLQSQNVIAGALPQQISRNSVPIPKASDTKGSLKVSQPLQASLRKNNMPLQSVPSRTTPIKTIAAKDLPKQRVNNPKADGNYIPIRSMVNATSSKPVAKPMARPRAKPMAKPTNPNRVRQKMISSKSPFQNQGRMIEGQPPPKATTYIYKVSPSV
ncbi:uncharacterized protein [Antedon mediterranea]|uniref:uncharacterized protein isoform X2 n=1 Tax=Antedon mediterranea TaxID=105859 RepID=UPI003AF9A8A8